MTLVLDIILAGIFIVLIATAAKKGFVLTVLEVVAIIAALFCASYIREPMASAMLLLKQFLSMQSTLPSAQELTLSL